MAGRGVERLRGNDRGKINSGSVANYAKVGPARAHRVSRLHLELAGPVG